MKKYTLSMGLLIIATGIIADRYTAINDLFIGILFGMGIGLSLLGMYFFKQLSR